MPRVPDTPSDDDLVLYYYGETRHGDKIRRRLAEDAALAERYAELYRTLEAASTLPVPEPAADYGARVWTAIRPRLEPVEKPTFFERWLVLPRPLLAGALVALLAVAFVAGRYSRPDDVPVVPDDTASASVEDGRQRVVLAAVSSHLERSERLLRDLANAPASGDLSWERRSADALIGANRLYRQASASAGQRDLAVVLDELERLLLEIARSPEQLAPEDMDYIRARVDSTLFKVEVVGTRLDQEQKEQRQHPKNPSSKDPSV